MSKQQHIVILSGAGISAESGLKTFRDQDGLWMGHRIEDVATPGAFLRDPQKVLDFYNYRRREVASAQPNAAHIGLAALENNYHVTVITQNIDDLHERAGSTNVLHLHGEIFKMRGSINENITYPIQHDITLGELAADGSQLRPAIVWFEENVPMIEMAASVVAQADIFVIVGTSLQVYPAAGLVDFLRTGVPVYVIDKKIPPFNYRYDIIAIEKAASEGVTELIFRLNES